MTREELIRAEEARLKAALPHGTFNLGNMDPGNCRVIADNVIFICKRFPKLGERLEAIEAGGEAPEYEWASDDNIAWTSNGRLTSKIVFRERNWDGPNSRARHTTCHEMGHLAAAEIDETPEGKADRARLVTRKSIDWERWADVAGAFFQRRPLPKTNALAKLIWSYCR